MSGPFIGSARAPGIVRAEAARSEARRIEVLNRLGMADLQRSKPEAASGPLSRRREKRVTVSDTRVASGREGSLSSPPGSPGLDCDRNLCVLSELSAQNCQGGTIARVYRGRGLLPRHARPVFPKPGRVSVRAQLLSAIAAAVLAPASGTNDFIEKSWWWTQSRRTGLRPLDSLLSGKFAGNSPKTGL
jgi:hypothetical protein